MSNAWYARYPGDYGRDTAHLSLAEHGAYGVLLDHIYSTGIPLPPDREALYRVCRAMTESDRKAVDSVVSQFFKLEDDGYHNRRADREIAKQAEVKNRLSSSGRRGAQKRWGADGPANGHPNGHPISPANGLSMAYPQPQPQPQRKEGLRQKPPPGDPRFQPFYQFACESYASKHGREPLWGGKERNGLKNLLKDQSAKSVPLDRLEALWKNFISSTEPFTVKQGDSLAYFSSNVGKFSDGPILAAPGKGAKPNGKPTSSDLAIQNARALGLNEHFN